MTGSRSRTVVPSDDVLSMKISPSSSAMIDFEMGNPSPVPRSGGLVV